MTAASLRLPIAVLLAACTAPGAAKRIYKYTDAAGLVHYTDQKPVDEPGVAETVVKIENRHIAEMRMDGDDDERLAHVFNQIAGPVEVQLSFTQDRNVTADPPLPLSAVLDGNEDRVLTRIRRADGHGAAGYELGIKAVPGDPTARADDVTYRLPLDAVYRIDQGFGGRFSHTDEQSRYAVDLAVEEGTPVLVARDGVVMQVEDDFFGAGLDREKFATRANVVRVLHVDGSMAVYAHLRPESVVVQAGRHVYVGQKLGESGNTGYSTGPHLHFAIQLNRGMRLVSVPFRLAGPSGPIAIPDSHAGATGSP